jgi:predicted metalloprotease
MRLDDEGESINVEDRRGQGGFGFGGGGGGGLLIGGGGIGTVVIIILALIFGVDPRALLGGGGGDGGQPQQTSPYGYQAPAEPGATRSDDPDFRFSAKVLRSTEEVWGQVFQQRGATYREPKLVVYDGGTETEGCGVGQTAMGPFYCPGDEKVYVDLAFFRELDQRFGAPGDFARAYVLAHEVGHHVQKLLGIEARAHRAMARGGRSGAGSAAVRLELQADCLAGVWASHARQRLEPGDIEEGLRAASSVGDDTLQRESRGRVVPDSFTHGTSAQRVKWFRTGVQSGDPAACDTFSARSL